MTACKISSNLNNPLSYCQPATFNRYTHTDYSITLQTESKPHIHSCYTGSSDELSIQVNKNKKWWKIMFIRHVKYNIVHCEGWWTVPWYQSYHLLHHHFSITGFPQFLHFCLICCPFSHQKSALMAQESYEWLCQWIVGKCISRLQAKWNLL